MAQCRHGPVERTMFVRKATGLVRGWSVATHSSTPRFDQPDHARLRTSSRASPFIPESSLHRRPWSCPALFIVFEVIVYASLIAVMPRAGRRLRLVRPAILGGGIGFVLAVTGWWFILWHWVPIYANILSVEVIRPTAAILGYGTSAFHADWWPYSASDGNGIFFASILTAILASVIIALGMRTYAKIQKYCFYGGMVGLVLMILIFLTHSTRELHQRTTTRPPTDLYGVEGRRLSRRRWPPAGASRRPASARSR